jgi:hypothetical protein
MAYVIKVGTYTGNATADRPINIGVDCTVENTFVQVWRNGTSNKVYKTDRHSALTTSFWGSNALNSDLFITSLTSTGFVVGSANEVNASGSAYYYLVITDDTGDDFRTGTYTGSGSARTIIIDTGWSPEFVHIKRQDANNTAEYRHMGHAGTVTGRLALFGDLASNSIESLTADGFTLGTASAINQNTSPFLYIAMKSLAGRLELSTFTGNSTDNRQITTGFSSPEMVWVDRVQVSTNSPAWMNTTFKNTDESIGHANEAMQANTIQALNSTGFIVGDDASVNNTSDTYLTWVFKSGTAPTGGGAVTSGISFFNLL